MTPKSTKLSGRSHKRLAGKLAKGIAGLAAVGLVEMSMGKSVNCVEGNQYLIIPVEIRPKKP